MSKLSVLAGLLLAFLWGPPLYHLISWFYLGQLVSEDYFARLFAMSLVGVLPLIFLIIREAYNG